MTPRDRLDALTLLVCAVFAGVLLWLLSTWEPARPAEPPMPTATAWVIVVTATPPAVPAGPPTTRTATPTWTPLPERLPMQVVTPTTREPTPTPTATPVPNTRVPATMTQRG